MIRATRVARVLALSATLWLTSYAVKAQEQVNHDIYGKWQIKALIGGGAASTLTQRDVDKLIGKYVTINPERFAFNGHTCTHPWYQRKTAETVGFFDAAWRTDVGDIGFPNPVTVIETGCNTLFLIRKDHLMIAEENVFLEAVRVHRTRMP